MESRPLPPRRRIIPAGAGKRYHRNSGVQPLPDHPRGCGEKGGGLCRVPCVVGIIPAGAGKSPFSRVYCAGVRDHPRGCGEKRRGSRPRQSAAGSSPRVRGKALVRAVSPRVRGIIPAGAGKRGPRLLPAAVDWDHPRGCGEKTRPRGDPARPLGSSPRVRGKVIRTEMFGSSPRIIPAGAGKRLG